MSRQPWNRSLQLPASFFEAMPWYYEVMYFFKATSQAFLSSGQPRKGRRYQTIDILLHILMVSWRRVRIQDICVCACRRAFFPNATESDLSLWHFRRSHAKVWQFTGTRARMLKCDWRHRQSINCSAPRVDRDSRVQIRHIIIKQMQLPSYIGLNLRNL